jgi:hypothetical protein
MISSFSNFSFLCDAVSVGFKYSLLMLSNQLPNAVSTRGLLCTTVVNLRKATRTEKCSCFGCTCSLRVWPWNSIIISHYEVSENECTVVAISQVLLKKKGILLWYYLIYIVLQFQSSSSCIWCELGGHRLIPFGSNFHKDHSRSEWRNFCSLIETREK